MEKSKEPVRLRKRLLKSGNTSLYLDIYADGRRRYEYLNLYLVPEKTRADRESNRETFKLADAVRAQRLVEFRNGRYGFEDRSRLDTNFLDYFRMQCDRRNRNPESSGNWCCWNGTLRHLEIYCRPETTFRDVTPAFVQGFKDYLDTADCIRYKGSSTGEAARPISDSTKAAYFNKFRTCLRQAYDEGIVPKNPLRGVRSFRPGERERVYLTLDEVRAMAAAECRYPALKNAFLFSCLTGLRKSDIEKMRWREVRRQGEFTRIVFRQKKTGGQEYIDISPQAVAFMGEPGAPGDPVFPDFRYCSYYREELLRWAARGGVTKGITFHSARHTFAVMMLDLGADIYTVQKLLGHKEIQTTQIYAKMMDKKKQKAAMLIPDISVQ